MSSSSAVAAILAEGPLFYGFGNLTERGDDVDLLFDALPALAAQKKVRRRRIRHHQLYMIIDHISIIHLR